MPPAKADNIGPPYTMWFLRDNRFYLLRLNHKKAPLTQGFFETLYD